MAATKRLAKGRIVTEESSRLAPVPLPISAKTFNARRRVPTQKRSQKTRRAILKAALTVADEQGIENLTMQSIAAQAKIAAGTAYQFYDDRDAICFDIYLEWAEIYWTELMEATAHALTRENWEEQARALIARMGRFYFETYDSYTLLRYVESTKSGGGAMRAIVDGNIDRYVAWWGPFLTELGYKPTEIRHICLSIVRAIRGHWVYGFASAAQSKALIRAACDAVVAIAKQTIADAPRSPRGGGASTVASR